MTCTGRLGNHPHEWTLARRPGEQGPDDVEKCVWCNAERHVPFELVLPYPSCEVLRRRNLIIGGYDYYSTSLGMEMKIVDASVSPDELLAVIADMLKESTGD